MSKQLSKNVKVLGVVSLLNDASSDMVYPLIPIFLTKALGASYTFVGLIEGIAESTASLLKVFSGWLSDKIQRRKAISVFGYSLSTFAKPLLAFAIKPWHVLFVRFADRFGKGIRQAPRDALIAESTESSALGFAYGYHKAMDTIGATIGPILAVILLPILSNDLRSLFLLSFVASALAVLTLVFFVREKHGVSGHHLPKLSLKILPRQYRWFLLAIAIFSIGNFSDAFLFLRSENVGIASGLIPVLYALSNVFFASFSPIFGRLADKIGPEKIMAAGYGVFVLTHLGFAFIATPVTVWLLFPMFGIFSSMTDSLQKTITVKISDPEIKGTMLGLTHTTIGIVQLPASIIAGALWENVGVKAPFLLGSSLALIASLILVFSFSKART